MGKNKDGLSNNNKDIHGGHMYRTGFVCIPHEMGLA